MASHVSEEFKASDYWHPKFWPMWVSFGLLRSVTLLPYPAQLSLGKIIGSVIRVLYQSRQKVVEINLTLCFPEKSIAERNKIKNGCFQNIAGLKLFGNVAGHVLLI